MSAQHENVNITVYRLPEKKRLGEFAAARMTHLYLPRDLYDEVILEKNEVFARKNGVFAAVLANGPLAYKPYDKAALAGLFRNLKNADLSADYVPRQEFDLCRSQTPVILPHRYSDKTEEEVTGHQEPLSGFSVA